MRMDRRHLSMGLVTLALVAPGCATPREQPLSADCPDIAETGRLNILTLNGLYDAPAAIWAKRWTDIAQFAVANNVHVLMLQEAVLTDVDRIQELLGTSDSARDFQRILNERSAEPYEPTRRLGKRRPVRLVHGQCDAESLQHHAPLCRVLADRVGGGF